MTNAPYTLHCWMGYIESLEFGSEAWVAAYAAGGPDALPKDGTCLLEDGHEGPHEFQPDDEIEVRFLP